MKVLKFIHTEESLTDEVAFIFTHDIAALSPTKELDVQKSQKAKTKVFVPTIKVNTHHRLKGKRSHTLYAVYEQESDRDAQMETLDQTLDLLDLS